MKIVTKIRLALIGGGCVVLGVGAFDYYQSNQLEQSLLQLRRVTADETHAAMEIRESLRVINQALTGLTDAAAPGVQARQDTAEALGSIQSGFQHLQELDQHDLSRPSRPGSAATPDPAGPGLREDADRAIKEFSSDWADYSRQTEAGLTDEAAALRATKLVPALGNELRPALDQYLSHLRLKHNAQLDRIAWETRRSLALKLGSGGVMLVLAGVITLMLHRGVLTPLHRLEVTAARAARGEGDFRQDAKRSDELGAVARALTGMLDTISTNTITKAQLESALDARTRELGEQSSELRTKSERLVLALDAASTSIWDFDVTAGRVVFDAGWSRMMGGPAVETSSSIVRLLASVHPEDRARVQRATQDCSHGLTEHYSEEYRVRNIRGEWVWLQTKGRVAGLAADGRATRMIGTNTDISQRKQAELAIARQVEFLSALTQTTLALLQRRSKIEILEALAERAAVLLACTQVEVALIEGEELVTHAYGGQMRTEEGQRAGRQDAVLSWQAIDSRAPVIVDRYKSLPAASPIYQQANFQAVAVFPILLGSRCLGVLGFMRSEPDRTFSAEERQKGELLAQLASLVIHNADIYEDALRVAESRTSALRESEVLFKGVFDESPIPIILLSFPDGRIIEANKVCETVFGYSREEVLGKTSAELGIWADPANRERFLEQLKVQGKLHGIDTHMRVKGGAIINVLYSASVIKLAGRPCLLSSVIDITAQKQAEAALRQSESHLLQAQKMESLGTLAGGIAHDFNNILTGILGHTQLAISDLPRNHPIQPWLEGIMQSGARARNLVHQILTFSRKTESTRSPIKLQLVLMETLGLLRSTLPAMVRIDHAINPACPPVLADGTQIHQIVLNLGTNAWHALPEQGGIIEVSLRPITLSAAEAARLPPLKAGPHVLLTMKDNGTGMDAATLERIFEPFFTTKPAGKGTGLGLAVAHSIVEAHDGVIRVQSSPGQGALFEIYLPALVGVETFAPAGPGAIPRGQGENVLVVDDEFSSGRVIAHTLGRLGYRSDYCANPVEALRRIQTGSHNYAMLLTDLAMPGLPGDELAKAVLALRPRMPVLLISGFIEPAMTEKLRALGVREILGKPPALEDLAAAVHRCLHG